MRPTPARENKMGTMPIGRLLLTMSGPMMLSMLIQALYNTVDSMFVARISEAALTAVSLAYPVQFLMIAVATGTGVGVNSFLSRNLGEKHFAMANRTAGNALFLGGASYAVFALLGFFGTRLYFQVQVDDPEILALGTDYLFWVTVLSLGCFGQIFLERLLQSTGKTFYSMLVQMIGAVLNMVLDPILIFGLLGAPAMGVKGAAVATVISQMIGMLFGIYFHWKKNRELTITLRDVRPDAAVIRQIYKVGVPSILLQMAASVLVFGLNQILVGFSQTAAAVYGVYYKLQGFAFMPVFGMNNGMVPILAYNYGARQARRITGTIRLAIFCAVGIMCAALLVFQTLPVQLLTLFEASPEMLDMGVPALRILSLCFVLGGFTVVVSSVYQALGRGTVSMMLSVSRQLLLVLPLAWLFSLSGDLNLVWWAFPVAEVVTGVLAGAALRRAVKRIILPLEGREERKENAVE